MSTEGPKGTRAVWLSVLNGHVQSTQRSMQILVRKRQQSFVSLCCCNVLLAVCLLQQCSCVDQRAVAVRKSRMLHNFLTLCTPVLYTPCPTMCVIYTCCMYSIYTATIELQSSYLFLQNFTSFCCLPAQKGPRSLHLCPQHRGAAAHAAKEHQLLLVTLCYSRVRNNC